MTWEQKFLALLALSGSETAICARGEGDWYCCTPGIELTDGSIVESPTESAVTPAAAVCEHWDLLTNTRPDQYIRSRHDGHYYVWNGFMWARVTPEWLPRIPTATPEGA